jgi:hypothetical protein
MFSFIPSGLLSSVKLMMFPGSLALFGDAISDTPTMIALDHLTTVNVRPGYQPGKIMFAIRQRTVKHQLNRPNAGKESIHTEQQWPSQDVMVNDLYQGLDQALDLSFGQ